MLLLATKMLLLSSFLGTWQLWKWKSTSYLYGTNLVYLISFHNTMTSKKWLLI